MAWCVNRLNDLLNALMMGKIEGPKMELEETVNTILKRAYKRWKLKKLRVPSRGNPGKKRKSKRKKQENAGTITLLKGELDTEFSSDFTLTSKPVDAELSHFRQVAWYS